MSGDCFSRASFLQPGVEYTPLATLLECFITDQIPGVGTTPSSQIHTMRKPSHHACGGYESQLDAISSAGGAI